MPIQSLILFTRRLEKYKIQISSRAEQDIYEIYLFIISKNNASVIGKRLIEKIQSAINSLEFFPYRHKRLNSAFQFGVEIRIMPVHKYLIFYYIDKTDRIVYIIRVLYHKRDYLDELQIEKR